MAARARREIQHDFTEKNAFSPARSIAYEPPTSMHRRQMEMLLRRGVLKETSDGRFWLDQQALRLEEERRKAQAVSLFKIMIGAIFLTAIGVAVAVALH